jgi:hypothetical protein
MKVFRVLFVLLALTLLGAVYGCGSRTIKVDEGAPPLYRMDDGSLCKAPAGYPDILEASGTQQVRALFLASTSPIVTADGVTDLPSMAELDAALYLSCGEYANRELSKDTFRIQRAVHQQLRLRNLRRGVQSWLDDPEGFETPGKVCLFLFNGDAPDQRNLTRLVPPQTTADDCAVYVSSNGGTHVLLGCSAGRWKMHWAPQRILVGPNGWANRRHPLAGTQYVPNPDCGWG